MVETAALLATYNGESFLRSLIDSIDPSIDIIVSDDGSSDDTLNIIKSYPNRAYLIDQSKKGSAKRNFSFLIQAAPRKYKYFFLVDQDDIWLPEKLRVSVNKLKMLEKKYGNESPLLVFSDSVVVDKSLNEISDSFFRYQRLKPYFANSIERLSCQNVAQGATMVFNRALLDLAKPLPEGILMHDWWLMLCAVAFGKIGYLNEPTILYRQHDSNEVGAQKRDFKKIVRRLTYDKGYYRNSIRDTQRQSALFLERYSNVLPKDKVEFLSGYSALYKKNWLQRRVFCLRYKLRKTTLLGTLGFYIFV